MRNSRVAFSTPHGAVDEVLDTCSLGSVSYVLALLDLSFRSYVPEIQMRNINVP